MSADAKTISDEIRQAAYDCARGIYLNVDDGGTPYMTDDDILEVAKAIHDAVMAEKPKLQPIETAPCLERIMVAGWQERHGNVGGYWWFHEDCVEGGKAIGTPHATHWFPIVKPNFAAAPKAEG